MMKENNMGEKIRKNATLIKPGKKTLD